MSEESQYYIPDKEDLFIGYECELLYQTDNKLAKTENYGWHKVTLDLNLFQKAVSTSFYNNKKVRTSYLTKADILNEGWQEIQNQDIAMFTQIIVGLNYELMFSENTKRVNIKIDDSKIKGTTMSLFVGIVSSINELKKIQKYIGVNKDNG